VSKVPAFTEANRQRVSPGSCACRVDDCEIVRCALHGAAPQLLKVLEAALPYLPNCDPNDKSVGARDCGPRFPYKPHCLYVEARAALDATKERP